MNYVFDCLISIINISFKQRLWVKKAICAICREAVLYLLLLYSALPAFYCVFFCKRSKCYIRAGQSHRDRVNKKLNCQECFIFAAFKIKSFFFPKEKKEINEKRRKLGHLITPLFKKGEFGVLNRLLFRVQWVGSRANV